MSKYARGKYIRPVVASVLLALGVAPLAFATPSSSSNYRMSETQFGAGSSQGCSGGYCARTSTGTMPSGSTVTSGGGVIMDPVDAVDQQLLMTITPGPSDLGDLAANHTATSTTQISISNTQGTGYIVQIAGDPPKFGDHILKPLVTPTASIPGAEQFGINLVNNTTPNAGADPIQVPAGTVFGQAASGYNTPDLFKYVEDDVIAQGVSKAGRTDYTITMIINISNTTPAGRYVGNFSALVVPVY